MQVQQLEQRLHRHIVKSRPYFEEKALCNEQLAAQKERVEDLQSQVAAVKGAYAASLKELERISEEIHCKRSKNKQLDGDQEPPCGPREPGVGAELDPVFSEIPVSTEDSTEKFQVESKSELQIEENLQDQRTKDSVQEASCQHVSPSKAASPKALTSPPKPKQNALPLLDNLNQMKNTIESCANTSHLGLSGSPEMYLRSSGYEDDFGKEQNADNDKQEAYNHALLNHLMENYESELDRCDMTSLSGMSVATGSSAVSEKDENEYNLEEVR